MTTQPYVSPRPPVRAPSLLALKATAFGHTLRRGPKWGYAFLVLLAVVLVSAEVYGTWRSLQFLGRFGSIGTNVFARILEIGLITLSSGVTFSATTTAISTLYLSDDLNFLLTQPLPTRRVFGLKVFETFLNTALVPLFLMLPLLATIGVFFHAPVWAYPVMLAAAILTFAAPVGLGALLAVGLMRVAPVGRVREVSTALGVLLSAGLVYAIRALRPEILVQKVQDPAQFEALLKNFASPTSPLLPPAWASQGIWQAAQGQLAWPLLPLLLLAGGLLLAATALGDPRLSGRVGAGAGFQHAPARSPPPPCQCRRTFCGPLRHRRQPRLQGFAPDPARPDPVEPTAGRGGAGGRVSRQRQVGAYSDSAVSGHPRVRAVGVSGLHRGWRGGAAGVSGPVGGRPRLLAAQNWPHHRPPDCGQQVSGRAARHTDSGPGHGPGQRPQHEPWPHPVSRSAGWSASATPL